MSQEDKELIARAERLLTAGPKATFYAEQSKSVIRLLMDRLEFNLDEIQALTHEGRQGELEQANVGLADESRKLQEENQKLKAAVRYLYMTIGFYATNYNYKKENWTYHPITGKLASGIMYDMGHDARHASRVVKAILGLESSKVIQDEYPGPNLPKDVSKALWECPEEYGKECPCHPNPEDQAKVDAFLRQSSKE
jgi:hypothetical protein